MPVIDSRAESGPTFHLDAPTTVLIADDHPSARMGVRMSLESSGAFDVCAEARDAAEAVALAVEHRPRVCLLDVRMPGSGIVAAAKISALVPDADIVMVTVSAESDDLLDALQAGASGYLLKDTDPRRLPEAVKGVLRGEAAIPRHLVKRLVSEFHDRDERKSRVFGGGKADQLTERQWEVLGSMREGLSTAEIAERLFVSQVTVRTHIASIVKKLQVSDRLGAVRSSAQRA